MLLKNKKVAIIGAGPVGLTMAILLQQADVNVTVYERDQDAQARIWGGTLDLHPDSGQPALQKAGLLNKYFELSLPMGIVFVDRHAKILGARLPQYETPEINRNTLRTMMLDSLQPGTVQWDSHLKELPPADLVIIANGGETKFRSYVNDLLPEETGTFILQGNVPEPERSCADFFSLCDGKRLMVAHDGNLLVANPFNNGTLTYGIIFKKPDDIPADYQTFLAERFASWDEVYHQLFRATPSFLGLTTKVVPADKPWKAERPIPITLIGDAAHLMPPFAGKGVNTGLADAMILAENLTSDRFETIEAAIADYERQMQIYAGDAQKESRENELQMRDPAFDFRQLIGS